MDDYLALDTGFLFGGSVYTQGDFNYDGLITAADYAILDYSFLTNPPPSPTLLSPKTSSLSMPPGLAPNTPFFWASPSLSLPLWLFWR